MDATLGIDKTLYYVIVSIGVAITMIISYIMERIIR